MGQSPVASYGGGDIKCRGGVADDMLLLLCP